MAVAQALAIVPGIEVVDAEPEADHEALLRLARWCHRITPLVSIDGIDGLWLDVTGCAHLSGGEAALLGSVLGRFARDGMQARAAVADTPGAAHALARHGAGPVVVLPGEQAVALWELPIAALRLDPALETTLRRLGFEQVGHLGRIPRALLARRFGPLPGLRLDQAHGRVHEPLAPLAPDTVLQRRTGFLEPLLTAEALAIGIEHLVLPLCEEMERHGLGARQLDLLFERVDSHVAAIRIGTARPSRDGPHLVRMLAERLNSIDPGLGVEAMQLVVPLAEPLAWEQQEGSSAPQDVGRLVDRLTNRLGSDSVFQASPAESARPDRCVGSSPAAYVMGGLVAATHTGPHARTGQRTGLDHDHDDGTGALVKSQPKPNLTLVSNRIDDMPRDPRPETHLRLVAPSDDAEDEPPLLEWRPRSQGGAHRRILPGIAASWPTRLQAPARLLDPPRPVEALAALPDQPPVAFTWRSRRYRVRRADGPERVQGEWWRDDEALSVRDYFQVEDDAGQRFWLFREGNGLNPRTGDLSWYLHGLF